ncbi:hypothetical protein BH11BAC1_BH11BAC1_05960 [soil metagenome]
MKKIYLFFISIVISLTAFSQALPNASFDNWTNAGAYDDPDNWNTLNNATSGFGVLTCQKATGADIHTGAAAIKLITQFVLIQNANGLATTGTINIAGMTVDGGIPYSLRPDSLTGWYKCDPQGADFGFVDFTLLDAAGTDTVGFAHFQTPNNAVTTYTYFSIAIDYHNANTPALSRCVMSSSEGVTSVLNSVLIIDDLALVFNPNGIHEPLNGKGIVYYNPANKNLHVFSPQHSKIAVIDMTGKKVFDGTVEPGVSDFTIGKLPAGLYVYMLADDARESTACGKFIAE